MEKKSIKKKEVKRKKQIKIKCIMLRDDVIIAKKDWIKLISYLKSYNMFDITDKYLGRKL
jgi:hypothetical protein